MTSLITLFFLSFVFSLVLTPLVSSLGRKFGLLDYPDRRKMHTVPIPRIGGVAISLSFFLSFGIIFLYPTTIFEMLFADRQIMTFALGGIMAFGLGLWDDIRRVGAKIKLGVQILTALIAWYGGLHIRVLSVFSGTSLELGILSLPFTIFWFLMIMNAVNLIDGLDGLAAGIVLFVSLALLLVSITTGRFLVAMGFAALAGSTLGFLRYNFSPASVFMGDGGSYFLGYMVAGLSAMGSLKGTATVAILIPVIALGVPLMDVFFAPIRRFILGRRIFSPDKKHLHHRLVEMGLSQRNAVLVLYGLSIFLGILAFYTVHAKSEQIAFILFIFGATAFLGIRKITHFRYLHGPRLWHWLMDIGDEMGILTDRRNFFSLQLDIYDSRNMKMLWANICKAVEQLGFDMAGLCLENQYLENVLQQTFDKIMPDLPSISKNLPDSCSAGEVCKMIWKRDGASYNKRDKEHFFKLEIPLIDSKGQRFGWMWVIKDLRRESISQHTLRRVEHLRRTVLNSLQILTDTGGR